MRVQDCTEKKTMKVRIQGQMYTGEINFRKGKKKWFIGRFIGPGSSGRISRNKAKFGPKTTIEIVKFIEPKIKKPEQVKVKDLEVGFVLKCILFIKAKGGKFLTVHGQIFEKGGVKHLFAQPVPGNCCSLSFGPGTIIRRIL